PLAPSSCVVLPLPAASLRVSRDRRCASIVQVAQLAGAAPRPGPSLPPARARPPSSAAAAPALDRTKVRGQRSRPQVYQTPCLTLCRARSEASGLRLRIAVLQCECCAIQGRATHTRRHGPGGLQRERWTGPVAGGTDGECEALRQLRARGLSHRAL